MNIQKQRYEVLKSYQFNPRKILDIGAYHGNWSLMMKEIFPEAEFCLIEPNDDCIDKIKQNGFDNVKNVLLGDKNQTVKFNVCNTGCGEGNSIYKEQSVFRFNQVQKEMQVLDSVVRPEFDLIKIDTQGSEKNIILGGLQTIRNAFFVQLETQVQQYNLGAPFSNDIIAFMDMIGFSLFDIIEMHYNSNKLLIQTDFLFAQKSLSVFHLNNYS